MGDGTGAGARISYGVTAVGVLLAGLVVLRATIDNEVLFADVREGALAVVLATVVAVLGASIDRFDVRPGDGKRVFAWTLLGGAATAAATGWFVYFQAAEGTPVAEPALAMTTPTALGTLSGAIVGIYDAERRAALARIKAERENLALLNRLLGHNVRNGINVVRGRVDALRRQSLDDRERRDLAIIDRRADRIARLVDRVGLLTDRSRELRPVALGPAVEAAAEAVRDAIGEPCTIRTTVPAGTYVRADEGLSELIELLLVDVIERAGPAAPTVTVTATPKGSLVVLELGTAGDCGIAVGGSARADRDIAPGSRASSGESGVVTAGREFLRSLAGRYDGTVDRDGETTLVATLRRTDPPERDADGEPKPEPEPALRPGAGPQERGKGHIPPHQRRER
jgi:signal transduction histidine kinase